MRLARRLLLVLLVAVLGVAVAVTLAERPRLTQARDRMDQAWTALRSPLAARYTALDGVAAALSRAGGPDRSVTRDLAEALARWKAVAPRPGTAARPPAEAEAANALEALAARARANAAPGTRLASDAALGSAFKAFDAAVVPAPELATYNRRVQRYERARTGVVRGAVAVILGFEARPRLLIGA